MFARVLLLLVTTIAGLAGEIRQSAPPRAAHLTPGEDRLLRLAAIRLVHHTRAEVVSWLRHQSAVRSARVGPDGQTIDLQFRGGIPAAILSASLGTAQLQKTSPPLPRSPVPQWPGGEGFQDSTPRGSPVHPTRQIRPLAQSDGASGRALLLEPFASELGLGPHAGDTVAEELREAGFQVTQAYDAAVTVNLMSTLSQYNLVYIHTHTGVNGQTGEAVIATGQVASDQADGPQVAPDWRTMTVAVAGSSTLYVGIMSRYITDEEGQFPRNAMFFVNGCDFLDAKLFWQALQAKGVAAAVSWDNLATATDGSVTAQVFFGDMDQGMTIDQAVAAVTAAGYGVSTVPGSAPAHFGYVGNGSLTLNNLLSPPTPTPAPQATATPYPTLVRPVAPYLAATIKQQVAAGSRQTIDVTSSPGAVIRFRVMYPNGDHQSAHLTAGSDGTARYTYIQGASKILHGAQTATVRIIADNGQATNTQEWTYHILFGAVDVSVQPRHQKTGKVATVWVHSWAHTPVTVALTEAAGKVTRLQGHTGPHGWVHIAYRVLRGDHGRVAVVALVSRGGRVYRTQTWFVGS